MSVHYNAFISYRHSKVDSEVAQRIQRELERFKIPFSIRRSSGVKKFQRIFRDKEELPLSVDLSDDINEALEHSDYLIVICSPRTGESLWVQREITQFLEHHSRERVLTVLAEGEPGDVIPEILTKGREPLSCDYRMRPRLAKKIELPRLAAAMLGCRYDDLRQRKRQQRARRNTILAAAALACMFFLTTYFYFTSREISRAYRQSAENYREAQENQSRFLSNAAIDLLDRGDRITALHLALAALPSDTASRPWTAEAELALSVTSGAYQGKKNLTTQAVLEHPDTAAGCFLTEDGNYLVSWSRNGTVYVWDAEQESLLRTLPEAFSAEPPLYGGENRLILSHSDRGISCMDLQTGETLWQQEAGTCIAGPDRQSCLITRGSSLAICSTADGACLSEAEYPEDPGILLKPMALSPDGKLAALAYMTSVDGNYQYVPLVYDRSRDSFTVQSVRFCSLSNLCFTGDGELVVSGTLGEDSQGGITMGDFYGMNDNLHSVLCFDRQGGQKWIQQAHYSISGNTSLERTEQALICCFGTKVLFLDEATGRQQRQYDFPAVPVSTWVRGEKFFAALKDGSVAITELSGDFMSCGKHFVEMDNAVPGDGCYYVLPPESRQILVYSSARDENIRELVNAPLEFRQDQSFFGRDRLVVSDWDDRWCCYDRHTGKELWQAEMPKYYKPLGFIKEERQLLLYQNGGEIAFLDLESGDITEQSLEENGFYEVPVLQDNTLFYPADGGKTLKIYDFEKEESRNYPLNEEGGCSLILPSPDGKRLLLGFISPDNSVWGRILDRESGELSREKLDVLYVIQKFRMLLDREEGVSCAAWSENGENLVLASADSIGLYDTAGQEKWRIQTGRHIPAGVSVHKKQVFVLYRDCFMQTFDLQGNLVREEDLPEISGGISERAAVRWQFHENCWLLNVRRGYSVSYILDPRGRGCTGYVPGFLSYEPGEDSFLIDFQEIGEMRLGVCPRYTTKMLTEMAGKQLNGHVLSREQAAYYGLEN